MAKAKVKLYSITCSGCDDHTTVEMELTAAEALTVKALCERVSEASTYGCMPKMDMQEKKELGNG